MAAPDFKITDGTVRRVKAIGLQAALAILTSFGLGVGLGWTVWGRRPEPEPAAVPELAPVEVRVRPARQRAVVDLTAAERDAVPDPQGAGPAPGDAEGRPVS